VWGIFYASVYGAKSSLKPLVADNIAVVAGIAFSLINVRIGLGRVKSLAAQNPTTTSVSRLQYNVPGSVGSEDLAYPMRPRAHVYQIKTETIDDESDSKVVLDMSLRDDNALNRV
ncbi:hypothetical protein V5O48_018420, partial [Marasmius crinis-equi]